MRLGRGSNKSLQASKQQIPQLKIDVTDQPTDRPMNRPMDQHSVLKSCVHWLKNAMKCQNQLKMHFCKSKQNARWYIPIFYVLSKDVLFDGKPQKWYQNFEIFRVCGSGAQQKVEKRLLGCKKFFSNCPGQHPGWYKGGLWLMFIKDDNILAFHAICSMYTHKIAQNG